MQQSSNVSRGMASMRVKTMRAAFRGSLEGSRSTSDAVSEGLIRRHAIIRAEASMPAVSRNQRIAAAIAAHHPEQLYARNKGFAKLTLRQLHEFAATHTKGLPRRVKKA